MKLGWVAGLLGIAAVVTIARPDAVNALYQQIYPSDPAQRWALHQCAMVDPGFNRLDPAARDACYRQNPAVYRSAAAAGVDRPAIAAPNFVDQWREAGQGHLSKNDIRTEQRSVR
jgi:hypothetical protein